MFFLKSNAFNPYYIIYTVRELTNAFTIPDKVLLPSIDFLRDDFILQYWFKLCVSFCERTHYENEIFPFPKYPKKKKSNLLDK